MPTFKTIREAVDYAVDHGYVGDMIIRQTPDGQYKLEGKEKNDEQSTL